MRITEKGDHLKSLLCSQTQNEFHESSLHQKQYYSTDIFLIAQRTPKHQDLSFQ